MLLYCNEPCVGIVSLYFYIPISLCCPLGLCVFCLALGVTVCLFMEDKIKWFILNWNIRGIGSDTKQDVIREKLMNLLASSYASKRQKENLLTIRTSGILCQNVSITLPISPPSGAQVNSEQKEVI
jgi:hypothetical protein